MKKKIKAEQHTDLDGIILNDRNTLDQLLVEKKLYDMKSAARIVGFHYRYLRRLCHARKVDHHKLLGHYYMTPVEVAALLTPIKADN